MMTQPRGGRYYIRITNTRKKSDFAACLRWLASLYKHATKIHLVMDHLTTHKKSSLTEAYDEIEGRRLWERFTPHYTPQTRQLIEAGRDCNFCDATMLPRNDPLRDA